MALLREADVLLENFRPGAMELLRLGYQDVRAVNPGIIYLSSTGNPYSLIYIALYVALCCFES